MICFDRIVRILLEDVQGGGQELIEHPEVSRRPVGGHLRRLRSLLEGGVALAEREHADPR